jgi:hypothetical protein
MLKHFALQLLRPLLFAQATLLPSNNPRPVSVTSRAAPIMNEQNASSRSGFLYVESTEFNQSVLPENVGAIL